MHDKDENTAHAEEDSTDDLEQESQPSFEDRVANLEYALKSVHELLGSHGILLADVLTLRALRPRVELLNRLTGRTFCVLSPHRSGGPSDGKWDFCLCYLSKEGKAAFESLYRAEPAQLSDAIDIYLRISSPRT